MNEKNRPSGAVAPPWSEPFHSFRAEMGRTFNSFFRERELMSEKAEVVGPVKKIAIGGQ